MTDAQKREEVTKMYKGPNWATKVKSMSDAQVFAIWMKNQIKDTKVEKNDESNPDIPF